MKQEKIMRTPALLALECGVHHVRSERRSESELQHARLIGQARVRDRQPIARVALPRFVGSEVCVVEQVVGLHDALERHPSADVKPLLKAKIQAMDRVADQVCPRNDGAVRTQAIAPLSALAQVTAVARGEALTGAVEIQPAQLETAPHLPDAVECGPMALVRRRERVITPQIGSHAERHRGGSAHRRGRLVIEA